jgi:hypothetical protein
MQEDNMPIATCQSYHAVSSGTELLNMPDGKSVFKIYYLSIIGRAQPRLYEWKRCSLTQEDFSRRFLLGAHTGIGFVTAFPHITKIFRFAPSIETVMEVKAYDTPSMAPQTCLGNGGFWEFACYAEAVIAAEEYRVWAASSTVAGYLSFWCPVSDFPITTSSKLGEYWSS